MNIADNLKSIKDKLPQNVLLVAVSKTKPASDILMAYNSGQRVFGENKALEMKDKYEVLPKDIKWHFIGHLQTNKIKYIASFVNLIHSVDSLELLKCINKEALKNNRVIDCLLQFHVAKEETKFGLNIEEAADILNNEEFKELKNIRICGIMGMATNIENAAVISDEFQHLHQIFNSLKTDYFANMDYFKEISMGMSHDYEIAIKEGSTMVRIGSSIFGQRYYGQH